MRSTIASDVIYIADRRRLFVHRDLALAPSVCLIEVCRVLEYG